MNITILTLFPDMFAGFTTNSIMKRALGKGVATINVVNIRDYTKDKYGRTDTPPIGGGAGLIEKAQPIVDALASCRKENSHVILMSPRGKTYDESMAVSFAKEEDLIIVCGHYEGIDERVNDYVDELVSIGDYVLTGGEILAMSFNGNLLEYPQYTEPYEFEGKTVPDILYSGNHAAIEKWRRKQSLLLTKKHRPDLFAKLELTKADRKLLAEEESGETPKWEKDALEKGKKFLHR